MCKQPTTKNSEIKEATNLANFPLQHFAALHLSLCRDISQKATSSLSLSADHAPTMATIFKLLVLALAGASALRVGTPASMKMPVPQDAIARPAAEQCRTDEPCAFFGGGGAGVPEGAK